MTPILLSARNIAKAYGPTRVLHGLDMEIRAGESIAILGQSGSGKTTLLSLLAGLEPPDQGQVLFGGEDLARLDRQGSQLVRIDRLGLKRSAQFDVETIARRKPPDPAVEQRPR